MKVLLLGANSRVLVPHYPPKIWNFDWYLKVRKNSAFLDKREWEAFLNYVGQSEIQCREKRYWFQFREIQFKNGERWHCYLWSGWKKNCSCSFCENWFWVELFDNRNINDFLFRPISLLTQRTESVSFELTCPSQVASCRLQPWSKNWNRQCWAKMSLNLEICQDL